jgi:3-oxoacyl-ACP reductase-like protein
MSIFSSIMSKIFGHQDSAASGTTANAPAAGQPAATGAAAPAPTTSTAASTPAAAPAAAPSQPVDVDAVLTQMQANHSEQLNWRTSIVDLLKLLGLDSSLSARKELASELHYTGNTEDSAAMNMWLHKQVMQKLAENGGKVPDDLK